jgi:diacylglycerol kinase
VKPLRNDGHDRFRHRQLLPRFRDAFFGLWRAYQEEPNLRFHLFAAICVGIAAWAVRVEGWEVGYLAVSILAVLVAELVNTAVERVVDLAAAGRFHPLAAQAKQVAAGAVLLSAVQAAIAAVLLFFVRRAPLESAAMIVDLLLRAPWILLLPLGACCFGFFPGGSQGRFRTRR